MKQIRTKLEFLESKENKRIITVKHSKDIKIFIENRKNHQRWYDSNRQLTDKYIDYIVILIPKEITTQEVIKNIKNSIDRDGVVFAGFEVKEKKKHYEISGYNRIFFSWMILPKLLPLENFIIVSEYVLPLEKGEMGYYINPKGIQVGYNLLGLVIELLYLLFSKIRSIINRMREVTYDYKKND